MKKEMHWGTIGCVPKESGVKLFRVRLSLMALAGLFVGCHHAGVLELDTDDDTGSGSFEDNDVYAEIDGYVCVDSVTVDETECGTYPEHDNDMWDLYAVVPNQKIRAYYDRNCDGEAELTEMDMYRDVYCHRDRIKSLVFSVAAPTEGG